MLFKNMPIRRKLMLLTMIISGVVVLLTCVAFVVYEVYTFRESIVQKISTLSGVIADNSTAALAFDSPDDAKEILSALKAEPHIMAACIYDAEGEIFSEYHATKDVIAFPFRPDSAGHRFNSNYLENFQPITQGKKRLGTLYLRSDLTEMYDRFKLYGIITLVVMLVACLLTFILSRIFQRSISQPILSLSETAKVISERKDFSVRAIKHGKDELGSLTDAFNDMLEEIHNQNEVLQQFNQSLEQRVTERTAELEALNRELESFSYTISHDLRAPVRAINSYINIFSEDYGAKLDDEGKRLVNIVANNSKKMGLLIDDLLAFSRLGRKELVKSNVLMKDLVTETWESLIRGEQDRKIEFNMGDLPDAYAEKSTLRQVWVNLLSNAIKYSGKKEKTTIRVFHEKKGNEVIYAVSDNGTGFDMRYYDKLFGVFQRLHAQEEFEGTGVGLAIVQRIVEKHGGKIWANAKVDEGATFYFSLPADGVNHKN